MGGANSKDNGRLHYRVHNIYLNFIETYDRLPPTLPVTIHQKALFCFWMSAILILTILQVIKVIKMLTKQQQPQESQPLQPESQQQQQDVQPLLETEQQQQQNGQERDPEALLEDPEDGKQQGLHQKLFGFFTATTKEQPPFEKFILKLSLFGAIMFYFWLCDFLHLWPKVEKQYSRDVFIFLFALLIIASVVFTLKKNDDKLLNRDQTEEWKGWMQVQFVWYHYFDAQETFNSIRCYIAAYVWMTGFGNLSFFWIKQDYSIFRLMKMMFRLNFLVVVVMAVTNHEFVRYYICAMHTYWFLSVWGVLVVFNGRNSNRLFMAVKFFIYAVINALIFDLPGASWKVFIPFNFILHDAQGGLRYWIYRSTLDHWTTIVGMLVAYNYPYYEKFMTYLDKKDEKSNKIFKESLRIGITLVSIVIFIVWFHWVLIQEKERYLAIHPYTSPIPILVYIWLRNAHPILRRYHLNFLTWLGKITLETYLSQIHIYMIGDAKKILVYLPNYPLLNFLVSTGVYLLVSHTLFKLTVFFSSYLLPRDLKIIGKNALIALFWFLFSYLLASILTIQYNWGVKKTGLEFLLWNITKT